jgi:NAD(P)-dependent dehydrogenase (short-subunit alcohol dehydrogenase family)
MPDGRLVDAVTVITGGASGIGRALAERFAAEGARTVVVADLDRAGAEAMAAGLPGGVGVGIAVNVADESALRALADRVETEIGAIDVYCSNAGIADAPGLGDDQQ